MSIETGQERFSTYRSSADDQNFDFFRSGRHRKHLC
jgi:hypothetical protein